MPLTAFISEARPPASPSPYSSPTPPLALSDLLKARARDTPDRPAISFEGRTWTFRELATRVRQAAGVLQAGGVKPGDRVAYLGMNHPAFFETLFATASLGAIFVPMNYRLTGGELAYALEHSQAHTLIADLASAPLLEDHLEGLPLRRRLSADGALPDWEDYQGLVADAPAVDPGVQVPPDAPALIMYTSGTTGRPKGVTLTHANLWWNNICTILALRIAAEDVSVVCAPIFHIGGLNATTLATMIQGGHLLVHRSFEPQAVLDELGNSRATTMFGVPIMCQALASLPGFEAADLSSLRLIITGGAPVPVGLIRTYQARDVDLAQGYGLTEAAPIATFLTPEHALAKIGSAGRPMLLCDVRVAGADGSTVAQPGEVGEIELLGPNVTPGYWNNPEATAAAFNGDWLRTGDAGYLDEDGFLFVTDRIKDVIITGGENVYPAEVEEVLFGFEAVDQVAVIGRKDEKWGERVVAVVRPSDGRPVTLEDLRSFADGKIGRYKLPTEIQVVDELPRNATGKVLKTELRNQFP